MKARALQEIMIGVEDLTIPESAKVQVLKLVSQIGLLHGNAGVERLERVMFARRLLDQRMPRPMIRERLVANFLISKRQAYRAIDEALQLCQKSILYGATLLETVPIEEGIVQE